MHRMTDASFYFIGNSYEVKRHGCAFAARKFAANGTARAENALPRILCSASNGKERGVKRYGHFDTGRIFEAGHGIAREVSGGGCTSGSGRRNFVEAPGRRKECGAESLPAALGDGRNQSGCFVGLCGEPKFGAWMGKCPCTDRSSERGYPGIGGGKTDSDERGFGTGSSGRENRYSALYGGAGSHRRGY